MSLNIGDPTRLIKPLMARGITPNCDVIRNLLFTDGDNSREISIRTETRDGTLQAKIMSGTVPQQVEISANANRRPSEGQVSQPHSESLTITSTLDNLEFDVSHYSDMIAQNGLPGLSLLKSKSSAVKLPICAFIDKKDIQNSQELAARYTKVIQNGFKKDVVGLAQTVLPDCKDVVLLQIGGISLVCGETRSGQFLPLSLLGDGASIVINVGLSLLFLQDGILLLDEFDTALHFSKLAPVWTEIARLARQVNCQIIAVTHSRECIEAAATALAETDAQNDFQFIRLDRVKNGLTITNYNVNDLNLAFSESWEVR